MTNQAGNIVSANLKIQIDFAKSGIRSQRSEFTKRVLHLKDVGHVIKFKLLQNELDVFCISRIKHPESKIPASSLI